jgi:hypothetical protein
VRRKVSRQARVVGILACVASIVIHASTVTLVGTLAAVVAAIVGLCIFLSPIGRRLTGRDLTRVLRVESATVVMAQSGMESVSVEIGVSFWNQSETVPVSRFIRKFDISYGEKTRPLKGEPPKDDVFEHQSKPWQAGLFNLKRSEASTTFAIEYTVDYGRLDKKTRKRLVGRRTATVTRPPDGGFVARTYAMSEERPDRHSRLHRKEREKK